MVHPLYEVIEWGMAVWYLPAGSVEFGDVSFSPQPSVFLSFAHYVDVAQFTGGFFAIITKYAYILWFTMPYHFSTDILHVDL